MLQNNGVGQINMECGSRAMKMTLLEMLDLRRSLATVITRFTRCVGMTTMMDQALVVPQMIGLDIR